MAWYDRLLLRLATSRGFVIGPGVVEPSELAFGHDDHQFSPPEYANYIATSGDVYAANKLRADALSALPVRLYNVRNGDKIAVERGPAYDLLMKVNPFWTFRRLLYMTELSLGLWGEAYWFIERGTSGNGYPKEVWWARPDRVRVVPHPERYIAGFLYEPANGHPPIPFEPQEVAWLRYPNPIDEYSGLSPLAAARLAADYESASMRANMRLHDNGMQLGGVVMPDPPANGHPPTIWTPEQAADLESLLSRRFKGLDRAHRWAVLRQRMELSQFGVTPKDADFVQGINLSLEKVARAYGIPLDMLGGQRTYENVDASESAFWYRAMLPEVSFISDELTEQLAPMLGVDLIELDTSGVRALQEDETEAWAVAEGKIKTGAITINEYRALQGLDPVAWGNMFWPAVIRLLGGEPGPDSADIVPTAGKDLGTGDPERRLPHGKTRAMQAPEYESAEHVRLWRRFTRRADRHEEKFVAGLRDLFRRQENHIIDRLRQAEPRAHQRRGDVEPFNRAQWVQEFMRFARLLIAEMVADAGIEALDDIGGPLAFNVNEPEIIRFIEQRAQRFAVQVNDTTWRALQSVLADDIIGQATIDEMIADVKHIMQIASTSRAETIARTEVIGANNGGTLEAWRQSGVVTTKTWIAALDNRTRHSHAQAHGQTVFVDDNFTVGFNTGPHPGALGSAEEDINCRCTMIAGVTTEPTPITSIDQLAGVGL